MTFDFTSTESKPRRDEALIAQIMRLGHGNVVGASATQVARGDQYETSTTIVSIWDARLETVDISDWPLGSQRPTTGASALALEQATIADPTPRLSPLQADDGFGI